MRLLQLDEQVVSADAGVIDVDHLSPLDRVGRFFY
jgi:hypothetical protein